MKISYGLTVCNEHEELKNLIEYLFKRIDNEDEIVIVYDQNRVTPEVIVNALEIIYSRLMPMKFQKVF